MSAEAIHEDAEPARAHSIARPLPPPDLEKLSSWDLYRSIGTPKLIVAPMVDASELVRPFSSRASAR